jgi:hypothetical protein
MLVEPPMGSNIPISIPVLEENNEILPSLGVESNVFENQEEVDQRLEK